jgi:hypothetical protein
MMNIAEYLIKCPHCSTETRLVSEEANPIIFHCWGCERSIVIHNSTVYTVSEEYAKELVRHYKSKACGKIMATKVSENVQKNITGESIQELKKLLEMPMDVREFINRIK